MVVSSPEFAGWLLGGLRCGLVAIDGRGTVTAFNAEARRILGVRDAHRERLLGGDHRRVLVSRPAVARLLRAGLDGRERPTRAELVLEGGEGAPATTIGFTLTPVRDEGGRVRGAALLFRDLTPFERSDAQDRLRDRLAALGEMAAGLAHELRNPLAGMEVLAGLLKRRLGDRPEELSLVEELLEELHAAATIVDGPLDFVRPVAPAREPVDWPELVEGALRRARARVRFAGRVERRYEPDLPPAHADPEQMRALLTNLIANALEAMSGGSDPRVHRLSLVLASAAAEDPVRALRVRETETLPAGGGAHPAGRELLVAIGDTGPGVPDELAERIFFPFFTTKDEGSGLGLATAQKLALAHGGSLSLERTPGGGALFQLRLPVAGGTP